MNAAIHTMPAPFSLTHVPFDFFPAQDNADRKVREWKLREAQQNNAELLARAAREANKTRFAQ